MKYILRNIIFSFSLILLAGNGFSQISPGELTSAHAHLEGLTNCTKCHVLGEKETTSKCLECHKEIKNLISQKKGYHVSSEVNGKKCAECHGEHFGRDFKMIRFDDKKFNHQLSGYKLEGKHATIKCADCHKTEFIKNKISQKKGDSYLGLGTECLSCHQDFHQNTLSANCISCHDLNAFRPAPKFNHAKTKFVLAGKHQTVSCEKCHKTEQRNGQKFQVFKGLEFASCTNCHEDIHQNKFGNDCLKCHTVLSFREVKSLGSFNHNKTDFPLLGKHVSVDCKKCHKTSVTQPLKHKLCTDCHADYHEKQFAKNGKTPDCIECHSVEGFSPSTFGFDKHNLTKFKLEGAHMATPCFTCHKKNEKLNFANLGNRCIDCHENIHKNFMDEKYIPEGDCKICHSVSVWNEISFDHKKTDFELIGKHKTVSCRKCHFKSETDKKQQQFKWENQFCTNCHNDIHFDQFAKNGKTDCTRCHTNDNWKPEKFDHNTARFKLDGKHEGLACVKCHKPTDSLLRNYIVYKFKDISCKSCH
jgi:hypothetical protein